MILPSGIRSTIISGAIGEQGIGNRGATNDNPALDTSQNMQPSAQPSAFTPIGPAHADAGQTILYHQELRAAAKTTLDLSRQVAGGVVELDIGSANGFYVVAGSAAVSVSLVVPPAVPGSQALPASALTGIVPPPRKRTWDTAIFLSVTTGTVAWPSNIVWATNLGTPPTFTGNASNMYLVRLRFNETTGTWLGTSTGGKGPVSQQQAWDFLVESYVLPPARPTRPNLDNVSISAPPAGNVVTVTMQGTSPGDCLVQTGTMPGSVACSLSSTVSTSVLTGGASSWTVTLTGSASTPLADWNAAIQALAFSASYFGNPVTGRVIRANDQAGNFLHGWIAVAVNDTTPTLGTGGGFRLNIADNAIDQGLVPQTEPLVNPVGTGAPVGFVVNISAPSFGKGGICRSPTGFYGYMGANSGFTGNACLLYSTDGVNWTFYRDLSGLFSFFKGGCTPTASFMFADQIGNVVLGVGTLASGGTVILVPPSGPPTAWFNQNGNPNAFMGLRNGAPMLATVLANGGMGCWLLTSNNVSQPVKWLDTPVAANPIMSVVDSAVYVYGALNNNSIPYFFTTDGLSWTSGTIGIPVPSMPSRNVGCLCIGFNGEYWIYGIGGTVQGVVAAVSPVNNFVEDANGGIVLLISYACYFTYSGYSQLVIPTVTYMNSWSLLQSPGSYGLSPIDPIPDPVDPIPTVGKPPPAPTEMLPVGTAWIGFLWPTFTFSSFGNNHEAGLGYWGISAQSATLGTPLRSSDMSNVYAGSYSGDVPSDLGSMSPLGSAFANPTYPVLSLKLFGANVQIDNVGMAAAPTGYTISWALVMAGSYVVAPFYRATYSLTSNQYGTSTPYQCMIGPGGTSSVSGNASIGHITQPPLQLLLNP